MKERRVKETREFMRRLLTTDLFDAWLLTEAVVAGASTWTVDGRINRAYYEQDADGREEMPQEDFTRWGEVRPVIFDLIRGKRTPLSFRFLLKPTAELSRDGICRIRFTEGHVHITSAVTMKEFSTDRGPEHDWDEACSRFLEESEILCEEL
ncbi:MAG: DUF5721 family protein [Lachnospiraceae bacterium]|nr:DUF5721 family protein [Lachnospiraceae bacterium]